MPSVQSSPRIENFASISKTLLKNRNWTFTVHQKISNYYEHDCSFLARWRVGKVIAVVLRAEIFHQQIMGAKERNTCLSNVSCNWQKRNLARSWEKKIKWQEIKNNRLRSSDSHDCNISLLGRTAASDPSGESQNNSQTYNNGLYVPEKM